MSDPLDNILATSGGLKAAKWVSPTVPNPQLAPFKLVTGPSVFHEFSSTDSWSFEVRNLAHSNEHMHISGDMVHLLHPHMNDAAATVV